MNLVEQTFEWQVVYPQNRGTMTMVEAFSQDLVSRITKLSKRQLEYWDQTDVIKPSIAEHTAWGRPRLYSFGDLIKLKVAAEMRRIGKLPSDMKLTIEALEARGFADPFVSVSFRVTPDGRRIVWIDPSTDEALDAHHGIEIDQTVETFGLKLRDLRTGLEETIQEITARRHGRVEKVRNLQGGQAVIEGTRVPTAKIASLRAAGWSDARILSAFPHLTLEDLRAAVGYENRARSQRSA